MKKFGKIILYLVVILILIAGSALTYVKVALPDIGSAAGLKVEITPARLERGAYLANHVSICMDCHSSRDWTKYAAPLDSTGFGAGGEVFDQKMNFPGKYIAPNITPYHLGSWSDGEIYRAVTSGVSKDGHALFPLMAYPHFGKMDTEDIYSVIAYIRSLPAIKKDNPASESDFPMNFIINTIPVPAAPQKRPSPDDQVAYGAYLVNAASCTDCHTQSVKGTPVEGMEFAGGFDFKFPAATAHSANITPDKETGIGNWTKEQFVATFKMYADSSYKAPDIEKNGFQTPMPWGMYAGMKTQDLEAIYTYLHTIKPVKNKVVKFTAN